MHSNITETNELSLLKDLVKLQIEETWLQRVHNFSFAEGKKEELAEQLKDIQNRISVIESELINIPDKTNSYKAKDGMSRQLNAYIEQLSKVQHGGRVWRKQGLMFENYFFSRLISDLDYHLTRESFSISIPFLYYSNDENDVDRVELVDFLKEEKVILNKVTPVNYVELRKYLKQFIQRLVFKFIEQSPVK